MYIIKQEKFRVYTWLVVAVTLFVTVLRGWRAPLEWAKAAWLVSYDLGFIKRALLGTLLPSFLKTDNGIIGVSFVISILLFVVLFLMGLQILKRTNYQVSSILLVLAFVSSPFISYIGFLNGYADAVIFLLIILAAYLIIKNKIIWASLVLLLGVMVHENILIIGLPVILILAIVSQLRKCEKDCLLASFFLKLWPLLIPVAGVIGIIIYNSFFIDAELMYEKVTIHLQQYEFIGSVWVAAIATAYTHSFLDYFVDQVSHFPVRVTYIGCVLQIVPVVVLLLIYTRAHLVELLKKLNIKQQKIFILAVTLVPFFSLSLHAIAWDTYRIWTYSIIVGFILLWGMIVLSSEDITSLENERFVIVALVILLLNIVSAIPLETFTQEHISLAFRAALYSPAIIYCAYLFAYKSPGGKLLGM